MTVKRVLGVVLAIILIVAFIGVLAIDMGSLKEALFCVCLSSCFAFLIYFIIWLLLS